MYRSSDHPQDNWLQGNNDQRHDGDPLLTGVAPTWTRAKILFRRQRPATAAGSELFERLTPPEKEVLRLVARGRSNSEIAGALFMAEATVKTHVTSILPTAGARDQVEAALVAVRAGEA